MSPQTKKTGLSRSFFVWGLAAGGQAIRLPPPWLLRSLPPVEE